MFRWAEIQLEDVCNILTMFKYKIENKYKILKCYIFDWFWKD